MAERTRAFELLSKGHAAELEKQRNEFAEDRSARNKTYGSILDKLKKELSDKVAEHAQAVKSLQTLNDQHSQTIEELLEKHRIALSSKDADHLNEKDAWQKSMDMLQTKTDAVSYTHLTLPTKA